MSSILYRYFIHPELLVQNVSFVVPREALTFICSAVASLDCMSLLHIVVSCFSLGRRQKKLQSISLCLREDCWLGVIPEYVHT